MAQVDSQIWGGKIIVTAVDDSGAITGIRIPSFSANHLPCQPSAVEEIKALFPHLNPNPPVGPSGDD